jgi:hypothetical protein
MPVQYLQDVALLGQGRELCVLGHDQFVALDERVVAIFPETGQALNTAERCDVDITDGIVGYNEWVMDRTEGIDG